MFRQQSPHFWQPTLPAPGLRRQFPSNAGVITVACQCTFNPLTDFDHRDTVMMHWQASSYNQCKTRRSGIFFVAEKLFTNRERNI